MRGGISMQLGWAARRIAKRYWMLWKRLNVVCSISYLCAGMTNTWQKPPACCRGSRFAADRTHGTVPRSLSLHPNRRLWRALGSRQRCPQLLIVSRHLCWPMVCVNLQSRSIVEPVIGRSHHHSNQNYCCPNPTKPKEFLSVWRIKCWEGDVPSPTNQMSRCPCRCHCLTTNCHRCCCRWPPSVWPRGCAACDPVLSDRLAQSLSDSNYRMNIPEHSD